MKQYASVGMLNEICSFKIRLVWYFMKYLSLVLFPNSVGGVKNVVPMYICFLVLSIPIYFLFFLALLSKN